MKFLHAADIHLGYRQYNSADRFGDFGKVFQKIRDCALEEDVQVCLIAGDLFHKSGIDPDTLWQAETVLNDLREAGVQTLVISGNHDRPRFGDRKTWLDYLDRRGLIALLESFDGNRYIIEGQSYRDIDGVRFIGVPWYGGSTRVVFEHVAEELAALGGAPPRSTVLMAHAAIEGQMPNMPDMLRYDDVNRLDEFVDYLALGHLHKPYEAPPDDPWIFNPGAIENASFDEARFTDKGVYLVEVDADGRPAVEKRRIDGRPLRTIDFPITSYLDATTLVDALHAKVHELNSTWHDAEPPVVNLVLRGNLKFDRARLDIEGLRRIVQDSLECLLVRVNSQLDMLEIRGDYDEELTVEQLERQVFADIAREKGYGEQAESWGHFLYHAKKMALDGEDEEHIYNAMTSHLKQLEEKATDEDRTGNDSEH